ncbi:MAG TPA: ubiquinone/menaquinone biosynthesis methyltransferase [Gemmatimonadaceae bacterium]|nr:ubiquinone/menaquinone biosynthesis methyltransferase [Gemmatimonadaceae bacterium]
MAIATDDATAIRAAAGGAEKRAYVRQIFSEIAPRYDFLNHVLSLNIDRIWRRKAIAELALERDREGTYLDLCAGTMDISVMIGRAKDFRGSVLSADFAEPMLREGRAKIGRSKISPVAADALDLPLPAESMSGAIVAFGIRNVAGLDSALIEVRRVLVPGGRFVILEFSRPDSAVLNALYQQYFKRVLPAVGSLISGHPTAYRYLPDSVSNFPTREELARRMRSAGFSKVSWRPLTFGVAAIHIGERPATAGAA